jgi:hypothetical protein
VLRSIPAVLALLLLAAHFYRAAAFVPAGLCVAAVALVFVRRPWAVSTLRLGLAAGTGVWLVTAWRIAQQRIAAGMPYLRMLVILGAVAAFTAMALWIFPVSRSSREARSAPRN